MAATLRPHTPAGAQLVRQRLTALQDRLRLISPPAYAPAPNRIAWLWRWSRRDVPHPQPRTTYAALLEALQEHVETLRQPPDLELRQLGNPCADPVSAAQPLPCAA
jgi:hypothetical protein